MSRYSYKTLRSVSSLLVYTRGQLDRKFSNLRKMLCCFSHSPKSRRKISPLAASLSLPNWADAREGPSFPWQCGERVNLLADVSGGQAPSSSPHLIQMVVPARLNSKHGVWSLHMRQMRKEARKYFGDFFGASRLGHVDSLFYSWPMLECTWKQSFVVPSATSGGPDQVYSYTSWSVKSKWVCMLSKLKAHCGSFTFTYHANPFPCHSPSSRHLKVGNNDGFYVNSQPF